ncbi:MAG: hypothetical protein LUC83_07230, partial [Clostridiales bacterium]|nr:hypothetical protein [Clostridiales bacterium]
MKKIRETENLKRRLFMCLLGIIVCGISVGFFRRASFGMDPFQTLMFGLDTVLPISYGVMYILANLLLLLFALFADRHFIGLGTVFNLFLSGYIVDFSRNALFRLLPDLEIPGRIVCLGIAILLLCLSSSFYFTADLGVSTYDAVALIITQTWHKGQFRWVRILTDFVCVLGGIGFFLLSGSDRQELWALIGFATIITA